MTTLMHHGIESFKKPLIIENNTLHVTVSVGVSFYPNDATDTQTLLRNADAAMYKAKHNGRNTYSYYSEDMTKKAFEQIYIKTQLRKAFEKDELKVYYQPQIDTKTNTIIGAEALVRWDHPEMGLVCPDKFIPLAERTGMIIKLDRIVMQKAIKQFKSWYKQGFNPENSL